LLSFRRSYQYVSRKFSIRQFLSFKSRGIGCGDEAALWRENMKKTVLIVEDNELNMKLFNDLLEAHGYETVQTKSGVEAVGLARSHRPDLILMDIQLPEVSGLQVTQWLKDDPALSHIPVVAITAFAMKGDEEKIRQGGCEAYLSKPISVVKFLETVRNYIGDK
jgi:two-component system cell cycle response regulator DivK